MRRYLLLPLAIAVLGTASAQDAGSAIPILNPQFNVDVLSCAAGSTCNYANATGWLCGPQTWVSKLSSAQFSGVPQEGLYVVALGDTLSTGSILQTLGATVQANTTYTLKVSVGARADYPFTGYVASLGAGNVTLAFDDTLTPAAGSFLTDVIVYKAGANPLQLGQPLQIFVKSLGPGQVDIAHVSLTAN